MNRLHILITAWLACLVCTGAWAIDDGGTEEASPDNARYRIELLVFANSNPSDESSEQWFPPRTLPVPDNLQVLMPALAENTETHESSDATAEATADLTAKPEAKPAVEAFTELTDISPDFEQAADRMRRSRYYRVLKLTAWEQALPQGAVPVAVVIRGGEVFGQHHELEGTLSLRRERYLHAHARFWLSRFAQYTGETAEEDWPALPALPQPPERLPAAAEPMTDDSTETTGEELPDAAANANPLAAAMDTAIAEDAMPYDEWPDYDWFAPARPDRIVLLDQKRKLRSNELHYIDHPLLGVILRIVPVDTKKTAHQQ